MLHLIFIMNIIKKFLVIALMSGIASVVCAQTPKKDYAKLSEDRVAMLKKAVSREYLSEKDSIYILRLLDSNNVPQKGSIERTGELVPESEPGDSFTVYISDLGGTYWLTYVVTDNNNKFVGRLDILLN